MDEMPQMYTKFNVETWVESAMRYFTSRNFRVVDDEGKVYGYGRSIWAMIDTESRQPTDIFAIDNGAINNWIVSDKECPIDKGGRVKMDDSAQLVATVETKYNDVDINGHINSVKYIEHVLDLWNLDWYRQHRIKRFEIAYVAEAMGTNTMVRMVLLWNTRPEYIIKKVKMTYNTQKGVLAVMPRLSKPALTMVLGRSVALRPEPKV